MIVNDFDEHIVTENDIIEAMLQNKIPSSAVMKDSEQLDKYNHYCEMYEAKNKIDHDLPVSDISEFHSSDINNWFMPDKYKVMDVERLLLDKIIEKKQSSDIQNSKELSRVSEELLEYNKRGLMPLLKFLIYMVDNLKENKVTWGVGRGSSVSSYILYLIGVHKVDSLVYELNYKEFLK